MKAESQAVLGALAVPATRRPGAGVRLARLARRQPLGAAAAAVLIAVVGLALLGPYVLSDPDAISSDLLLRPASSGHILGTDYYGRDLFARIVSGARVSLGIASSAVVLSMVVAAIVGVLSAYTGGLMDAIVQRVVDTLMALPGLILVLTIVAVLGFGTREVVIALAFVTWPPASRVVRSAALVVIQMPYVEAARSTGCGPLRIVLRHVLPQVVAPWLVLTTTALGSAILAEAAISFLGFGVAPPQASWGNMLSGQTLAVYRDAPWLVIEPGLALAITVFSVNVLGDALRDALDPRLRGS